MKITIITLFPEMFKGPFDHSIVKRAIQKDAIQIKFINIRDFGIGKHKLVDDKPFGGGAGMILRVDVLEKAIEKAKDKKIKKGKEKVFLLGPHGKVFNSKMAKKLDVLAHLILLCGHYEGVDERIKKMVDGEISIGDFILTGGEIPAMLITDAVVRLQKGVIREGAAMTESFFPYLEYPQYTQPRKHKNMSVPAILLSGNHKEIEKWKKEKALAITKKLRPDLIFESHSDEKRPKVIEKDPEN
ncbi:MAG: tRNA (guanosine(37)-N1)-methyltransferase TrmD [Candidatus Levybacteria bacterium RBG_16_35_11]|nr:MAG: tRNA (guanosine(37)-N1)-methyltransferase TrmD [Candidatus Levybacteria bacterium RBG_16_35_11]